MIDFLASIHTETVAARKQVYGDNAIAFLNIAPVPLSEDGLNFFTPFDDKENSFASHVYSVIYKPVTLILMSLNHLLASMTLGLTGYYLNEFGDEDEYYNLSERIEPVARHFCSAVYMLCIFSWLDTLSAVVELVTNTMASAHESCCQP